MSALTQIACPACGTGNRVAAGHVAASAKCGQCGKPLFPGAPIDVDDAAFARHLRHTKGAVLIDIWAPWCGPCRLMAPHFAEAAQALSGDVVFLKMNADKCATPAKLGVRGIPALFLYRDGERVAERAGLMTAAQIESWVRAGLAPGRST